MQPGPYLLHNGREFSLQAVLRGVGNCGSNSCFCRVDNLFCHSQEDALARSGDEKSKGPNRLQDLGSSRSRSKLLVSSGIHLGQKLWEGFESKECV